MIVWVSLRKLSVARVEIFIPKKAVETTKHAKGTKEISFRVFRVFRGLLRVSSRIKPWKK